MRTPPLILGVGLCAVGLRVCAYVIVHVRVPRALMVVCWVDDSFSQELWHGYRVDNFPPQTEERKKVTEALGLL